MKEKKERRERRIGKRGKGSERKSRTREGQTKCAKKGIGERPRDEENERQDRSKNNFVWDQPLLGGGG